MIVETKLKDGTVALENLDGGVSSGTRKLSLQDQIDLFIEEFYEAHGKTPTKTATRKKFKGDNIAIDRAFEIAKGNMAALAEAINSEHNRANVRADEAKRHARQAGEYLTRAKEVLDHGEFSDWLKDNFEGTPRTANRYMDYAKKWKALTPEQKADPSLSMSAVMEGRALEDGLSEEAQGDAAELQRNVTKIVKASIKKIAESGRDLPSAARFSEVIAAALSTEVLDTPNGEQVPAAALIPANIVQSADEANTRQQSHIKESVKKKKERSKDFSKGFEAVAINRNWIVQLVSNGEDIASTGSEPSSRYWAERIALALNLDGKKASEEKAMDA